MGKPDFVYRPFKSGGRLAGRARASQLVTPPKGFQAQSAESAQPISVDTLLGNLAAKLPKAEADKLKKFIARLDRERIANRDRQKAFRDRKRQAKV